MRYNLSHGILLLKTIRIHQWVKNLLVFAPLFFSYEFLNPKSFQITLLLFFAFSFLASSVYIINDILDRKQDVEHHTKKFRPIASGEISVRKAVLLCIVLITLVILLAIQFPWKTNAILGLYLVLNISYSIKLKHIPLIEIFLVALLYLLRIKAGGELLDIPVSEWLLLVTFFLALFLVVGKRRTEFRLHQKEGSGTTRAVLAHYNEAFLDHLLTVVIAGVILSYSLYTVQTQTPYMIYSSFFVFLGMFRYLYIIQKLGLGEAPERMLFHDRWLLGTIVAWALFVFSLLYHYARTTV